MDTGMTLEERAAEKGPHPYPLCIQHGKPITWEDLECEICKSIKEGTFNGEAGANNNFRDSPGRESVVRRPATPKRTLVGIEVRLR